MYLTRSSIKSIIGILAGCCLGNAPLPAGPNETAALASMQSLSEALELCALDTNYYVSLETLNDIGVNGTNPSYDYLNNEGGTWVIPPALGRFNPARVNLLTAFNEWQGPYVNYQQGQTQAGSEPYDQGSPLDPWGNPYRFYTPLGLVRGDSGSITLQDYGDAFDRYTLVSYGFDGAPEGGDDVFYQFGGGLGLFAISSVREVPGGRNPIQRTSLDNDAPPLSGGPVSVRTGAALRIRGLNFGATQGSGEVRWGTTTLSQIQSWSGREIRLTLPPGLLGTQPLRVANGAAATNAVELTIFQPLNAALDWNLYE